MLYLIGCTLSYKEREIAQITVKIFKKLGIDFIIFENESYYDSPLLRTGRYDQALELMKHNIKMIEDSRAEKVVFSCAGCYRTFNSNFQKELGKLGFKLQHISQFLDNLLNENKLKLKNKEKIVTYREPCHFGRHEKIYDEPRNLIKAIHGIKLNEMDRNLINVWCCDAACNAESAFKNHALNTSKERIREEELADAEILHSCSPFFKRNLENGSKKAKSRLKIMNLTGYLINSME